MFHVEQFNLVFVFLKGIASFCALDAVRLKKSSGYLGMNIAVFNFCNLFVLNSERLSFSEFYELCWSVGFFIVFFLVLSVVLSFYISRYITTNYAKYFDDLPDFIVLLIAAIMFLSF